jgi:hypothetical protein
MAFQLGYAAPIPSLNMDSTCMKDEWQRWLDSFKLFTVASKLNKEEDEVQRATLLHLAGTPVQTILTNLPGNKATSVQAIARLNEFFAPRGNKLAERYRFKCRVQQPNETTDKFVSDLRKLGASCTFADLDEQIISQVIEKCQNVKLREKLLTEGDNLTLERTLLVARTSEQTLRQL